MNKILSNAGWALLAIVVVSTFYLLWKQSQPTPDVYEVITPQNRDITKTSVATGTLEPRVQIELKPKITGIVQELRVKPGDIVKKGDLIAIIKVIPDMNQLNQAQSNVESARIELEQVEREAARSQALFDKGVVSREENEQNTNRLSKARENLKAAHYQVDVITTGSSLRSASVSTTEVRSTMNGLVLDVPVKVGTSVSGSSQFSDGMTIAKIGDMSDVVFNGSIDETEVAKLQLGMSLILTPGAMKETKIPATLEYIAPEGKLNNGAKMFEIKAAASVPKGVVVRSGYSTNASIILSKVSNVISVDETCITFKDGKPYVYKLTSPVDDEKNQTFECIGVKLGISDGRFVQVTKGVTKDMHLRGIKK